mmetsp:Transcript_35704/g.76251  ORF Transcript_35704/g.76251 Transcript_35704/m.76251 type:complete len:83 (+) Transcript_35704:343-591(+)
MAEVQREQEPPSLVPPQMQYHIDYTLVMSPFLVPSQMQQRRDYTLVMPPFLVPSMLPWRVPPQLLMAVALQTVLQEFLRSCC